MQARSVVLGLALSGTVALSAVAAPNGPYAPDPAWTGFYFGVNGGYGWSDTSNQLACPATGDCPVLPFPGLSPEGGFGGGQIGYNLQGALGYSPLIVGIEADIQGADVSQSTTDALGDIFTSKLDWFGTVRGRLGFVSDSALFYATGGFAFGGIQNVADFNFNFGPNNIAKIDRTATGYVVGGGLEYKFSSAWSLKSEYQYINLGENDPHYVSNNDSYKGDGNTVNDDVFHTVRIGLNYKLGGTSYQPLK